MKKGITILINLSALLLVVFLYYFFIFTPWQTVLKEKTEKEYISEMQMKSILFDNAISRYIEGTKSISSRSAIRKKITDFYEGKISYNELKIFTTAKYIDGINALDQFVFAARYVDKKPLVQVGNAGLTNIDFILPDTSKHELSIGFFSNDTLSYTYIISPVKQKKSILAYDIIYYTNTHMLQQIADENIDFNFKVYSKLENNEKLLYQKAAVLLHQNNKTVYQIKSKQSDAVLQFTIHNEVLFKDLQYFYNNQILVFLFLIITLSLVLFIIHRRAKFIFFTQNKYLEELVAERTKELQVQNEEYAILNEEYAAINEEYKSTNEQLLISKEQIENSEARFRNFVNHSPDIIYKYSSKRGGLFWSDRVFDILEIKPDELIKDPFLWNNSIHPEDKPKVEEAIANYSNGDEYTIEYRIKTKQGKWVWLLDYFMQKKVIGDEIIIEGHATDITSRKEVENALKRSEYVLNETQRISKIGGWEYDVQSGETYFSDEVFNIYGLPEKIMFKAEKVVEFYHPDDRGLVLESFTKAISDGISYDIEVRLINARGENMWVNTAGKPISKNGKIVKILGTLWDITDRKKAEKILIESEAKLKVSNNTKDKFFSIIAHDLKSPFNALLGFSNMLLKDHKQYDEEKREEMINSINSSAKGAFDLLENLLTWAQSQSGVIEYRPEKINLKILLSETVFDLQGQAINKNIQVLDTFSENELIFADKNMIATVLRNLVSNAIKFTHKNGKVIIGAEQAENNMLISVTDTGVGMDKDELQKIFAISEKVSTSGTENETGTGLGLILCKEFVEKHGGEIWVESEIEKGSTFSFTIPKTANVN